MFVNGARMFGRRIGPLVSRSRELQTTIVRFNKSFEGLRESYDQNNTWVTHPVWYYEKFEPIVPEYLKIQKELESFKKLYEEIDPDESEGGIELLKFLEQYTDDNPATDLEKLTKQLEELQPPEDVVKEVDDELVEHCKHFKEDKPSSVKSECPCNTGGFLLGFVQTLGSIGETVSGITSSLSKFVGWTESDKLVEPAVKQRKLAVDTLQGVIDGENGTMSCAAVMYNVVEPFYNAMGEIFAAGIGSHYVERLEALKLMPTDKNLKSVADGENVYWSDQGWTNLGSWIQGDTRLNMLKESRKKDWWPTLTEEQKQAFNKAQVEDGGEALS